MFINANELICPTEALVSSNLLPMNTYIFTHSGGNYLVTKIFRHKWGLMINVTLEENTFYVKRIWISYKIR